MNINIWALISGLIGSLISSQFMKGINPMQRGLAIVSGTVISYVLTPMIVDLIALPTSRPIAIALLLGLFSWTLVDAIIRTFRNNDLLKLISDIIIRAIDRISRRLP